MPIVFEKRIDLTSYEDNPDPKVVEQLSIVHEARNGEIVQYYIDRTNRSQRDKNSYAIGIYDSDTDTWSYTDYDEIEWGRPRSRISGNRIEHISIKAFPNVGSIAVYKLMHRNISRIMAPVNPVDKRKNAPVLEASINTSGDVEYSITPPEEPEYDCYRLVMRNGDFSVDHITYDLTGTVKAPSVSGQYEVFAIGYRHEAQVSSYDSNVVTLSIQGEEDEFVPPYYTKSQVSALIERIEALEADMGDAIQALSTVVEVSDANA